MARNTPAATLIFAGTQVLPIGLPRVVVCCFMDITPGVYFLERDHLVARAPRLREYPRRMLNIRAALGGSLRGHRDFVSRLAANAGAGGCDASPAGHALNPCDLPHLRR